MPEFILNRVNRWTLAYLVMTSQLLTSDGWAWDDDLRDAIRHTKSIRPNRNRDVEFMTTGR